MLVCLLELVERLERVRGAPPTDTAAVRAVLAESARRQRARLGNALVRWPVAPHFGWITAASLVNLHNWLARRGTPLRQKEAAVYASVAAAVGLAAPRRGIIRYLLQPRPDRSEEGLGRGDLGLQRL